MSRRSSGSFPWSSFPVPEPGTVQRGWIPASQAGASQGDPYIIIRGVVDGPAIVVRADAGFAVTHGVLRLADVLDGSRLHGTLLLLPGSLRASRELPGMLDVLRPASAIIDLETVPTWKASLSYAWWHAPAGRGDERGRDVAHSFNLPFTLATDFSRWPRESLQGAGSSGSLLSRVVISEGNAGRDALAGRVMNGIVNALRVLGSLEGLPSPTETVDGRLIGIARAPSAGLWIPEVEAGEDITPGHRLGQLRSFTGEVLGSMLAVHQGTVLACSLAVQVEAEDPLVWVVESGRFVS